jgi:hemerythrin
MRFKWGKDLVTHIPALDDHHKGIFDAINKFCDRCDEDGGTEEVIELLDTLDRYTRKHFAYEEGLQRINNYPGLLEQQEHHASFLADLAELKRTLESTGPTRQLAVVAKGKLIRWLSGHIKTLDKDFVDFLSIKAG